MRVLRRILGSSFFFLTLGVTGTLGMAISAWSGDRISLVILVFFSIVWIVFSFFESRMSTSALAGWRGSLEAWEEMSELSADLASLLTEALGELTTYNPEKAQEIAERGNTIIGLRRENFEERTGT